MFVKQIIKNNKYYIISIIISMAIGITGTYWFISKGTDTNISRLQTTINDQSGTIEKLFNENSELTKSRDAIKQSNTQFEQTNARLQSTIKDLQGSSGTIVITTGELQKDISSISERESTVINSITKLIIESKCTTDTK